MFWILKELSFIFKPIVAYFIEIHAVEASNRVCRCVIKDNTSSIKFFIFPLAVVGDVSTRIIKGSQAIDLSVLSTTIKRTTLAVFVVKSSMPITFSI